MTPNLKYDENPTKNPPDTYDSKIKMKPKEAAERIYEFLYPNIVLFTYFHAAAFYGLYLVFASAKFATFMWGFFLVNFGGIGITAGSHRLWCHRTYKAKLPLQILLMVMNSVGFENSIIHWCRDHRMHHKYTDTDADPHNATRGFFFSHIGWLLVKKHDEVKRKGLSLYMDDLKNNPVLLFQKKYSIPFIGLLCFGLPTLVPMLWGETLSNGWHLNMLRYVLTLHGTFSVNSVAHIWGNKPYDKKILPVQNTGVSYFTFGEGFHNYHHVFPHDYRTSEMGCTPNMTTAFIDFFAKIGWAYDLKTAPPDLIRTRALRTGDGTYELEGYSSDHDEY